MSDSANSAVDVVGSDRDNVKSPRKKKERKQSVRLTFSAREEAKLAEWIEENPILYNSKLEEFRDRSKKISLYEEKAKEFPHVKGCSAATLEKWTGSMRTQFGRLLKKKSGSAAHRYTERELWILKTFQFLESHIVRRRTKSSGRVSIDNFLLSCISINSFARRRVIDSGNPGQIGSLKLVVFFCNLGPTLSSRSL